MELKYLKFKKDEWLNLIYICVTLAFLFTLSIFNFTSIYSNFIMTFISFFLFIFILLSSRLVFMKYIAYNNGFEIDLKLFYFNRFWFRNWDKTSYWLGNNFPNGIVSYIISLIIYVLTFGFIIFTSIWQYSIKKIPHKYVGTQLRYENYASLPGVSDYRYSKALFGGVLYFFAFAFFIKFFSGVFEFEFINPYIFILYWISFFTTFPIPHTEGYELWSRNRFAWLAAISILIFSMLALLILTSLTWVLVLSGLSVIVVSIVVLWKMLM